VLTRIVVWWRRLRFDRQFAGLLEPRCSPFPVSGRRGGAFSQRSPHRDAGFRGLTRTRPGLLPRGLARSVAAWRLGGPCLSTHRLAPGRLPLFRHCRRGSGRPSSHGGSARPGQARSCQTMPNASRSGRHRTRIASTWQFPGRQWRNQISWLVLCTIITLSRSILTCISSGTPRCAEGTAARNNPDAGWYRPLGLAGGAIRGPWAGGLPATESDATPRVRRWQRRPVDRSHVGDCRWAPCRGGDCDSAARDIDVCDAPLALQCQHRLWLTARSRSAAGMWVCALRLMNGFGLRSDWRRNSIFVTLVPTGARPLATRFAIMTLCSIAFYVTLLCRECCGLFLDAFLGGGRTAGQVMIDLLFTRCTRAEKENKKSGFKPPHPKRGPEGE